MSHGPSILLLLICYFPFQQWKPRLLPSIIHLLNYSILVYMYSGFRILNPYSTSSTEFLLSFIYRLHWFLELLRSAPFPLIFFNEVVSFICNTVRLFCHILHSILRPSHILNDLRFFFYCILKGWLCAIKLSMSFDKRVVSCIHHYNIIWNSFNASMP